eukprot:2528920-Rhodomonas_salina.3
MKSALGPRGLTGSSIRYVSTGHCIGRQYRKWLRVGIGIESTLGQHRTCHSMDIGPQDARSVSDTA